MDHATPRDSDRRGLLLRNAMSRQGGYVGVVGCTLRVAGRMNRNKCRPRDDLASTGYYLADPGRQYLVYQPDAGQAVSVRLRAGKYIFEWLDPSAGKVQAKGQVVAKDGARDFPNPLVGHAVLFIHSVDE